MPNIAEKSKVFGGKGVVLSFTRAPDVFLYRELIPGTKKYRYKVIDGANTLEAAIDKSLDAYNALRSEILEHAQEVAIRKAQHEIESNSSRRRARMITENMVRSKKVSIRKCLNNFLDEEQKKVDADLLKEKSLQNKAQGLKQLEKYLSYKGIEKTHQIDNNTFQEYITWRKAKKKTFWCLIGCSIGDFGTIFYFQNVNHSLSNFEVMSIAVINGILTSILLETLILLKQMNFISAIKTALGMSLISMVSMEVAMNLTDIFLTGGALLTWWVVPIMLIVGFITPLPYNYWRLKKYNISCH